MAKAIINKHIDSTSDVNKRDLFLENSDLAKGEILINNDKDDPSIFIVNTENEVVKISSGETYDDTQIKNEIEVLGSIIETLQGDDIGVSIRNIAEDVVINAGLDSSITDKLEYLENSIGNFTPENTVESNVNIITEATQTLNLKLEEQQGVLNSLSEDITNLESTVNETAININQLQTEIENNELIVASSLNVLDKKIDNNEIVASKALNSLGEKVTDISDELQVLIDDSEHLKESIEVLTGDDEGSIKKAIDDTKAIIDNYTVNGVAISTNVVLTSDDIAITDSYSTVNQKSENIFPGDIITAAISKLEVMLANTTLAITAAINDIDYRLGRFSEYDENGVLISKASGICKRIEEVEGDNTPRTRVFTNEFNDDFDN